MATGSEIDMPRGLCPVLRFGPDGDRTAPIVLLFMDAFGPRPALAAIADRLAARGHRVVMPDLFYRHRPYAPLDPASVFARGADRDRLMAMLGGLDQAALDEDVTALLADCAAGSADGVPFAAVGYCIGGRYALTAATLSPRIALAASFHGSGLAPETGESAHRRFAGVAARIYVGVAGIDPTFGAAEEGRLAAALREAGTDHMIETYAGAAHGFVMADLPVHDAAAAARHRDRLDEDLPRAFAAHPA